MKNVIVLIFALAATTLFAQPNHDEMRERKEKMDAMKAAYLTQEMDLSTEEAQAFWPVYNELDKKIEKLRFATAEKMMNMRKEGKKVEDMSDEQLQAMMLEQLNNDEKIAQLKKEYHSKFIEVLGVKKTAKMYMAERSFNRELMRKSRGERGPDADHKRKPKE